jgi:hypothetical protein
VDPRYIKDAAVAERAYKSVLMRKYPEIADLQMEPEPPAETPPAPKPGLIKQGWDYMTGSTGKSSDLVDKYGAP